MSIDIPKVSVCCATYNHEKYLRKALDSIFMQITDFRYEVIVGEDCSTDNSRIILDEYKRKHPDSLTLIYRDTNVGPKENFEEVYSLAKGKYIIVLETDDYWISKNKLQIQYDYLESHPDVIAVAHQSSVVDGDGKEIDYIYPSIKSGNYTHSDFRRGLLPGQTTTIMHRNIYNNTSYDLSLIHSNNTGAGDLRKVFTLLRYGKIYCIDEKLAAYRYVKKGGSSFVANHKSYTALNEMNYFEDFVDYAKNVGDKRLIIDAEVHWIMSMLSAYRHGYIRHKELVTKLFSSKYLLYDLFWIILKRKR